MFNSGTVLLIKDLIAAVNPTLRESHLNVRNSVIREPINNPNLDVPILHFKTLNTNVPVCKEERNGCMRRNSDTTVK